MPVAANTPAAGATDEHRFIAYEKKATVQLGQLKPQQADTTQHLRLQDGEKIPRHRIWMEEAPPPSPQLEQKIAEAEKTLSPHQLWQAASGHSLTLSELAAASGSTDCAYQLAVLRHVLANPIYFRRYNGRIHAVEAAIVEKALAAEARKQQKQQEEDDLLRQLQNGTIPERIKTDYQTLLYAADKGSPTYRALAKFLNSHDSAARARFFIQKGIMANELEYLDGLFASRWQPAADNDGSSAPDLPDLTNLPVAATAAISIDDAGTCEIDDAFSVQKHADGSLTVGIHIAAAALFIPPNSAPDIIARRQLTSVYFPHAKHFMLPAATRAAASLTEAALRPAVSLYLAVAPDAQRWQVIETKVEQLPLAHALTPEEADSDSLAETAAAAAESLALLKSASEVLAHDIACPKPDAIDYKIDTCRVQPRARDGSARMVEIFMRCANTVWAAQLARTRGGVFRENGAFRLYPPKAQAGTAAAAPYMWLTSPLRRYVDLANQRLLLAVLGGQSPPAENWRNVQQQFSRRYALAQQFQRMMDTYWALRHLQQQLPHQPLFHAVHLDKRRLRLTDYPLTGTLTTRLPPDSTRLAVRVDHIDLLQQRLTLTPAELD